MTTRALIVLAAVVAVLLVVMLLRRLPRPSRTLTAPGMADGTYLFTSAGCETCTRARDELARRGAAFDEVKWTDQPEVFDRLGIDAVPSVVVVRGGRGRWWRGAVPRQIPGSGGRSG